FFFQAEDGIRVFHVTGVQTCALPIFMPVVRSWPSTIFSRCAANSTVMAQPVFLAAGDRKDPAAFISLPRWRPRPESNRGARICSPLRNHSATRPCAVIEHAVR